MALIETWSGTDEDRARIEAILDSYEGSDPMESLIPSFHDVQEHYRYVPEGAARIISDRWHIPMTDIFNVLTFYSDFRTEPAGRNMLWICEGAACYFMGGPQLGKAASEKLGIEYGETTPDGEWTLKRADFCFGACHMAPLVELNHDIHGPLTEEQLSRLIEQPPVHADEDRS